MKLPRYWRFGVAAVAGLLVGALIHGTLGTIVGVTVAITLIVLVERLNARTRRR